MLCYLFAWDVPDFSLLMRHYFEKNKEVILCVSPLVRLELLVKPLKENNREIVDGCNDFLEAQQRLEINDRIFDQATNLRAKHSLKTPDAIHLATAQYYSCSKLWTNDDRLNNSAGDMAVNIFK